MWLPNDGDELAKDFPREVQQGLQPFMICYGGRKDVCQAHGVCAECP